MDTTQRLALRYVAERHARHEFSDATAVGARWTLLNFVAACPPDPRQLRRRHVESWLARQHVAANTLYSRLGTVRAFLGWMAERGYVRADRPLAVRGPRRADTMPRALDSAQVAAVLSACPDARARLAVHLMVLQGLRRGEVVRLQVGDLDLDTRMMLVRGKGRRERWLPLLDGTRRAIDAYLAEWPATSGPLLRSYRDPSRPLTAAWLGEMVADWMRAAGVKQRARDGRSSHSFRHTCASDVLDGGAHIRQVQTLLGHASLSTTQVYLRRADASALRPVMEGRDYASG